MRQVYMSIFTLIIIGMAFRVPVWADDAKPSLTVEQTYLGLSTGTLQDARLTQLTKGLVLRADTVTITEQQVAAEIAKANPEIQADLKKHRFFVLEQVASRILLLQEARAWAQATQWPGKVNDARALLNAYLSSIADKVTVTDAEVRAYYEANQEMMGGAPFDTVAKELRGYVLTEKRQQAIDRHVQTISARMPIDVDAAWVAAQAKTSLDNPVDKARRTGKPAMIDFGAEGCRACDLMTPILQSLQKTYGERCTILFSNVRLAPILAARYGIQSIPVQVFFDKDGHEVFRHFGYFPKAEVIEQLAKLGVH